MMGRMLRDHQSKQTVYRQNIAKKQKVAQDSVEEFSSELMNSVNTGVSVIFVNQKKIEEESQKLQLESQRFAKQTTLWLQTMERFYDSFKELGDVENWASTVEEDMQTIADTLE
eukprot:CAMPEP_0201488690 /NCGR_PEP_ID=MMETSP0151_2-20130828/19326_1 /ASSEMBLY_ACC=CAM_ASM_000257 /TAXON_ID=200890 /ORGANISM="Paramoeba atlantica, Strain 621/1 / CCAP 1560/9" /LENGTH=113 /DNA_ID=CAMNT_0047874041 /DNA_START=53 /DNA_END=391 /DNA_ORIENTATION=-